MILIQTTPAIQLKNSIYLNTLNNWLGSVINIQGNLEVEINEYTLMARRLFPFNRFIGLDTVTSPTNMSKGFL